MRLVFLLSFLFACSPPPLSEGSYSVTLDDVPVNECGVDDAILGLGSTTTVQVSWDGDEISLAGFGPGLDWDYDGAEGFSTAWTEEMEVADPCYLASDFEYEGTILTETTFAVDGTITQRPEGECATGQVTTCVIELVYSGVKD